MNGILLIDKPKGWTSHDVVAKLRSTLTAEIEKHQQAGLPRRTWQNEAQRLRVGHAGTLDPMATGLLIILIGSATKQQQNFMKLDKTYKAVITLGATSNTDDAEGEISNKQKAVSKNPDLIQVKSILENFTGTINQMPPQFSAVKVGGKRAYRTARKGGHTELKPRLVNVYSLKLEEYSYPLVRVTAKVSSGTYIRSLARDIGEALQTGAYLSSLRRSRIGNFKLENACSPEDSTKSLMRNIRAI